MQDSRPYRKNVGIVVFNSQGQVLVGERMGMSGSVQMPQGGTDDGEEPLAAALRELEEETGLSLSGPPQIEILNWLSYDFPEDVPDKLKKYRGQMQKWFFFYWDGDPASLSLDHHQQEFSRLFWADFEDVVTRVVAFKQEVYRTLFETGRTFIKQYVAALR